MKTIHELVKDQEKLNLKIKEHQNEIRLLQQGITDTCNEIKERFGPKELLGHVLTIKAYSNMCSADEEAQAFEALNGRTFMVKKYGTGYKKIMEGRLCKVIAIDLMHINADKKELRWMITAIPANANGQFGNLIIRTNVIDKLSLSD